MIQSIMHKSEAERFWEKVDKTGDCWEWTAFKLNGLYGRFGVGKRIVYAHRWAYESVHGPIPDGLQIDHLCRNKGCVNPDHLEAVSPRVNTRRALDLITHCPHGHEYTESNTVLRMSKGYLSRTCRECNRLRLEKKARSQGVQPVLARTHCGNGHEWTPENTYISPNGRRHCRGCINERQREYYRRNRKAQD